MKCSNFQYELEIKILKTLTETILVMQIFIDCECYGHNYANLVKLLLMGTYI